MPSKSNGGQSSNHHKSVAGTPHGHLLANERYGHFSYAIPVAPGSYTVNLYFAETYWGPGNAGGGGPGSECSTSSGMTWCYSTTSTF
jgi:hypothetical protein